MKIFGWFQDHLNQAGESMNASYSTNLYETFHRSLHNLFVFSFTKFSLTKKQTVPRKQPIITCAQAVGRGHKS